MKPVLSAQDVSVLLECTIDTINAKFAAGELPGLKFGRSWVAPTDALIECLNAMAKKPPKQTPMTSTVVVKVIADAKKSRRRVVPDLPAFIS